MAETNYVSRYTIRPYDGEYATFPRRDDIRDIPYDTHPTVEQCEVALEKMDRRDIVEIKAQQWAKQAVTEWMKQAAAEHNLDLDDIRVHVRYGITDALDELCPE
jgi:hypothetical protein